MRKIIYNIAQGLIFSLIAFLLLIVVGCGSRKVQKSQTKEETKTEIAEETKAETKTETKNDIVIYENTDDITIEPIDTVKPMTINGNEYKNARIKHKKKTAASTDRTVVNEAKNEAKTLEITKQDYKETTIKNVERKAGYWWLLWFLLIIPIYFIYRYLKFSSFI